MRGHLLLSRVYRLHSYCRHTGIPAAAIPRLLFFVLTVPESIQEWEKCHRRIYLHASLTTEGGLPCCSDSKSLNCSATRTYEKISSGSIDFQCVCGIRKPHTHTDYAMVSIIYLTYATYDPVCEQRILSFDHVNIALRACAISIYQGQMYTKAETNPDH